MPAQRTLERRILGDDPTSVAMIGIDNSKRFNNTHGYPSGNHALAAVADTIRQQCRQSTSSPDGAARKSSCSYLAPTSPPHTPPRNASVATSKTPRSSPPTAGRSDPIAFGGPGNPRRGCTISIGVATAPGHGTSLEELTYSADEALYRAKNNGRNRLWTDVQPAPEPVNDNRPNDKGVRS